MGQGGVACPKPIKTIRQVKDRAKRQKGNRAAKVRVYVFGRERNICRCCRKRRADSMHELRFRSLGGKVSRQNSVAVCGDGVNGCHGYLQRNEISYVLQQQDFGAERALIFRPETRKACEWMELTPGHCILSEPMVNLEIEA